MRFLPFILLLAACGGAATSATTSEADVPSAPPPPAASTLADVGPDGPPDISVVAVEISTDHEVIEAGEQVFKDKGCGGCHQFGAKLVGPDLAGVTTRRTPTWIAKMVQHPEEMTKKDPQAKKLFGEMMVQMSNQGVSDDQIGPLIAYLNSKTP